MTVKLDALRTIYSQGLDIRLGDLRVRRLSLNRHRPEKNWVASHRHTFSQFLVYLHGRGNQQVDARTFPATPGSVFHLPPGVAHAFIETTGVRPLCLAIDYTLAHAAGGRAAAAMRLTGSEFRVVRRALAALHRWHPREVAVEPREAAAVLDLVDVLLRAAGVLSPRAGPRGEGGLVRRVREVVEREDALKASEVAARIGYHRDHLNRLLQQTGGVSVGQLRAEARLRRAKAALRACRHISQAAEQAGFADPNYFSRWFRLQTGSPPGAWRRREA